VSLTDITPAQTDAPVTVHLDQETPEEAEERGIADAMYCRPPSPGFYIDEYMAGYASEAFDFDLDLEF